MYRIHNSVKQDKENNEKRIIYWKSRLTTVSSKGQLIVNNLPDCVYLELYLGPEYGQKKGLFFHIVFNEETKQITSLGR